MASPRQRFDVVATLLVEVQQELARKIAEQSISPSALQAATLGIPSIAAMWAGLRTAERTDGWTLADTSVLVEQLHVDLLALRAVLRGDLGLSDPTNN